MVKAVGPDPARSVPKGPRDRETTRLTTLANLPVALWLSKPRRRPGGPDAEAFHYWSTGRVRGRSRGNWKRPTGEDSLRERAIEAIVEGLASPDDSDAAKRDLVAAIRNLADGSVLAQPDPPHSFVVAVADVVLPVVLPRRPSIEEVRTAATELLRSTSRLQLIAAPLVPRLCQARSDAKRFWGWGRRFGRGQLRQGSPELPPIAWVVPKDDPEPFSDAVQHACINLLAAFGAGLRFMAGVPQGARPDSPSQA